MLTAQPAGVGPGSAPGGTGWPWVADGGAALVAQAASARTSGTTTMLLDMLSPPLSRPHQARMRSPFGSKNGARLAIAG